MTAKIIPLEAYRPLSDHARSMASGSAVELKLADKVMDLVFGGFDLPVEGNCGNPGCPVCNGGADV